MIAFPLIGMGPFQTPPFIPYPKLRFICTEFQIVWSKEFLIWSTGRIRVLSFIFASSDVRHSFPALTGQLPKQGWTKGTAEHDVCRVTHSEWESRGNPSSFTCSANHSHSLALWFYKSSFPSYDNRCCVKRMFQTCFGIQMSLANGTFLGKVAILLLDFMHPSQISDH